MAKAGLVCKLSTRCAVLAAANPRNLYSMSEPEGTSSLNIGIASPLLSRFDLVYILRDERNENWDSLVCDHLLNACMTNPRIVLRNNGNLEEPLWSVEKLQSHFVTARSIHPQVDDEANQLLATYYKACRNDIDRDPARTTVRLFDSLVRLCQANARLMFRNVANVYDAVMVIRLMESTYGFGRILKPFDVIKQQLPLSPTEQDVNEIFRALGLDRRAHGRRIINNNNVNINSSSNKENEQVNKQQNNNDDNDDNDNNDNNNINNTNMFQEQPTKQTNALKPMQRGKTLSSKELDQILSLDDDLITEKPRQIAPTFPRHPPQTTNKDSSTQIIKRKSPDKLNLISSNVNQDGIIVTEVINHPKRPSLNLGQPARNRDDTNQFAQQPGPTHNSDVTKQVNKVYNLHSSQKPSTSKAVVNDDTQGSNKSRVSRTNPMFFTQSDDSDTEMDNRDGTELAVVQKGPSADKKNAPVQNRVSQKTIDKLNVFQRITMGAKETNLNKVNKYWLKFFSNIAINCIVFFSHQRNGMKMIVPMNQC